MSCAAPAVSSTAGGGCDSGDTAWLMTAACLVLLMHPALAMYYGGMVSDRSIVNTMLMTFLTACLLSCTWALYAYSLSFGDGSSVIGSFSSAAFDDTRDVSRLGLSVPEHAFFSEGCSERIPLAGFSAR